MNVRALAVTAVTAALLLGTAGCGFIVPTATDKQYAASDGVSVDVGDLHIRNVLLITDASGDGSLIGTVVNSTVNPQSILAELRGSTTVSTTIAAPEGFTHMGNPESVVIFGGANLVAGTYVPVYFQYGGQDGVLVTVPVLDGTDPLYAPFEPTTLAPAPVVTETPVTTETPTP